MNDGRTYGERALNAFETVVDDNPGTLLALLDMWPTGEIFDLLEHAEHLAKACRTLVQRRIARPAGDGS